MTKSGQEEVTKLCEKIYKDTKDFLYEKQSKDVSKKIKETGFQILYGPPHLDAPILFLGYQPGKGCKTPEQERAGGAEERYPKVCEFATECWALAVRLQQVFGAEKLEKCVGLNAIFVRSNSVKKYEVEFIRMTRDAIKEHCLKCVSEIIEAVRPKKIVVIGLSTLGLMAGQEANFVTRRTGKKDRILTRSGTISGRETIAILHLSGARISTIDREKIYRHLREFCDLN